MDSTLLTSTAPDTLANDDLIAAIVTLAAHMNAAEHRLIALISEWDTRNLPGTGGTCTAVQWLGWQCGIGANAAREKVRVARALRSLPLVRDSFARGEVSYSKVREVTRVATAANEALLLAFAKAGTAGQTATIVRSYRRVEQLNDPQRALRQAQSRGLRWHFDDDGMLVIEGRFPPEEGAVLLKALEAAQAQMREENRQRSAGSDAADAPWQIDPDPAADADNPVAARRADALVRVAECAASGGSLPSAAERHLVDLHIPADGTPATLATGAPLPRATAQRLTCDATVLPTTVNAEGRPLSVGRRQRTVPWWLRRKLEQRDGGCRFPGCTHRLHLHAHHIVHWSDGGETCLDNLVLLCSHHHRVVHDLEYRILVQPDGRFAFQAPDGADLPNALPMQQGDFAREVQNNVANGVPLDPKAFEPEWRGGGWSLGDAVSALWTMDHGPDWPGEWALPR